MTTLQGSLESLSLVDVPPTSPANPLDLDLQAAIRIAGRDRTLLLDLEKDWRSKVDAGQTSWTHPPAPQHERNLVIKLASHLGLPSPQLGIDQSLIIQRPISLSLRPQTLTEANRSATPSPVQLLARRPSSLAPQGNAASTSPPLLPSPVTATEPDRPLRIMRRTPGESRTGSNGSNTPPPRAPVSMSDREKAYRAARQRIFGDAEEASSSASGTSTPSSGKSLRGAAQLFDPNATSWQPPRNTASRHSSTPNEAFSPFQPSDSSSRAGGSSAEEIGQQAYFAVHAQQQQQCLPHYATPEASPSWAPLPNGYAPPPSGWATSPSAPVWPLDPLGGMSRGRTSADRALYDPVTGTGGRAVGVARSVSASSATPLAPVPTTAAAADKKSIRKALQAHPSLPARPDWVLGASPGTGSALPSPRTATPLAGSKSEPLLQLNPAHHATNNAMLPPLRIQSMLQGEAVAPPSLAAPVPIQAAAAPPVATAPMLVPAPTASTTPTIQAPLASDFPPLGGSSVTASTNGIVNGAWGNAASAKKAVLGASSTSKEQVLLGGVGTEDASAVVAAAALQ